MWTLVSAFYSLLGVSGDGAERYANQCLGLSTPFWEFLRIENEQKLSENIILTFYSLLGVSL